MGRIVTLGEIMLRLSTPGYERFMQAESFDVCYGGGEANVAVSLAEFGHDASFVTKLPANEIGDAAVSALRRYGVDTSDIVRGGDRVGIYFLETGASVRPSKVVYDRAHSAIAEAVPSDFDFEKIFEGAEWFHFTGITPAISDNAAAVTKAALIAAKKKGLTRRSCQALLYNGPYLSRYKSRPSQFALSGLTSLLWNSRSGRLHPARTLLHCRLQERPYNKNLNCQF